MNMKQKLTYMLIGFFTLAGYVLSNLNIPTNVQAQDSL